MKHFVMNSSLICHGAPNYDDFIKLVNRVLDRHAPQKKRYIRANQKPFITLQNRYLKLLTFESKIAYNKQQNDTVNLLQKENKIYYNNLDLNNRTYNKQFWRNVKRLLSDKISKSSKTTLVSNNHIVSDDRNL